MSPYGRLEIYWPEGPVESIILNKEIVAIGRQTGNDLVLDRKGVSRYHVTLKADKGQVILEDLESVNGVYVDGVRLKSGEKRPLRGGEEIQIADVRMVIYVFNSLEDTVPAEVTENVAHVENEIIVVHFNGPDMVVVPGADVRAILTLENLTAESLRVRVQILGVPREWLRLDRTEFQMAAGAQTEILASFKPARRSDSKPGNYPLTVIVEPVDHLEATIQIESQLRVGAYSGFGMVMGTEVVEGKEPFSLHIHNQGNAPLTLSFRGVDPASALNVVISPHVITLQPGERQTIQGMVSPRKGSFIGKSREYQYDIIALSHDASGFQAAVPGRYIAKPVLPSWVATLAVPLVAIATIGLIVLVALLIGGNDNDDESAETVMPAITQFSASQTEVTLGEPVQLSWNLTNARNVTITYVRPGQAPQSITVDNPDVSSYQLQLQTTGLYDITLNAENTGGIESEVVSVAVKPAILNFSSNPVTLIQNVNQAVRFSWDIEGEAVANGQPQVFLESPELSELEAATISPTGFSEQTVFPTGPVTVTLRVIGQDGIENSRTLAIAVEEPRCLLSNPEARVYAGPNINPVGTMTDIGAVVNPLLRNAENTWLQIVYNGEPAWVRVADFQCQGFETAQLNIATDIPPTPTLAPTTAPATPTRTPRPTSTPRPRNTPRPTTSG